MKKTTELVSIKLPGEVFLKQVELPDEVLRMVETAYHKAKVYTPNIVSSKLSRMLDATSNELAEYRSLNGNTASDKAMAFCSVFALDSVNHEHVVKLIQYASMKPEDTKFTVDSITDIIHKDGVSYMDVYKEFRESAIYDRLNYQVGAIGLVKFIRFAQAVVHS